MLAKMLLHSAAMTGAAIDPVTVVGMADAMAPVLAQVFPLGELKDVYERTLLRMLADSDTPSVMVTARDLLATWHLMVAERKAEEARQHERNMIRYRQRMEARLREQPRQLHSVAALAERDGVTLPWQGSDERSGSFQRATAAPTMAAEGRETADSTTAADPDADEAWRSAEAARIARNHQAWHLGYAKHEQDLADKTRDSVSVRRRKGRRDATK